MMGMPEWTLPEMLSRPASSTEKAAQERVDKDAAIDEAIAEDNIYSTPTPTPSADATWLELKDMEV